ncbi:MAG: DUF2461 domain-containing protein [Nitrososphaerales archaeon]
MDFDALVSYLAELALNNNKPWFDEHRPIYERLRGDWLAFVGQVIPGIAQFDPPVTIVSPKDSMFRINRDVRFSKDKTPYKTSFSAAICPQGRSSGLPSYYFHITEAAELMIAGGIYMPQPDILGQIRKYIAGYPDRLSAVLADPAFARTFGTIDGERLKRPPQGYDETTPMIDYIKLKSFTAGVTPQGWLARQATLAGEIVTTCRAMFPLIRWLREALTGSSDVEYLSPQDIDRLAGLNS